MFGHIILGIVGLSGGLAVSAGLVALILELNLIPRYAGITHTAHRTKVYEACIAAGAFLGNLLTIYTIRIPAGSILAAGFGLFGGIFLGSWIIALTEMLGIFPILFKKTGIKTGFSILILGAAIGKSLFSLLYYYRGW